MIKKLALILLTGIIITSFWGCSADDPLTDKLYITDISGEDAEFESVTSEDAELDTLTIDASVSWDNTTLEELLTFYGDNSLVLYTPLYAPSLQGDSFVSKGIYHHTCNATNATWGSQGRTFGGNGYITLPDSPLLDITGNFTILMWLQINSWGNYTYYDTLDGADDGIRFLGSEATPLIIRTYQAGAMQQSYRNGALLSEGVWYFVGATVEGAAGKVWANGDDVTNVSGAHVAPASSAGAVEYLGQNKAGGERLNGCVGGFFLYDGRALSPTEINYIYEITKWKYGY